MCVNWKYVNIEIYLLKIFQKLLNLVFEQAFFDRHLNLKAVWEK